MPYQKLSPSDMVGLRTGKYKYFRAARDPKANVNLYDLENDPYENNSIAEENKELIKEFEREISEIEKNEISQGEEFSEAEQKRISIQLERFGYM